ncbi:MAG: cupin domain-containing protein [Aminobacteriaceae bacterium]
MDKEIYLKNIPHSTVLALDSLVEYESGKVVSLTLVQRKELGITLFAIDKGEKIGGHAANGDAMVQVLDGSAEITIGETVHTVTAGSSIVMPANIRHALSAVEAFKMLLIVVKPA